MVIRTNSGHFYDPNWCLRGTTLVLGAGTVGIQAHSYYSQVSEESFYLTTAAVLLVISIILTIAAFIKVHNSSVLVRRLDSLYHVTGGLVLLVAGVLMAISVVHFGNYYYTSNYIERIIATVVGLLNSLIYITVGSHSSRTIDERGHTTCCFC